MGNELWFLWKVKYRDSQNERCELSNFAAQATERQYQLQKASENLLPSYNAKDVKNRSMQFQFCKIALTNAKKILGT